MSELFHRQIEVQVGRKNETGVSFDKLRVSFRIEKDLAKSPNSATVEVSNLDSKTRGFIESIPVSDVSWPKLVLIAGYNGNTSVLFRGDIAKMTTRGQQQDSSTVFECGDGEYPFQNATLDLSFAPGTTFGTVLNRLSSRFGVGLGQTKGINLNDQFLGGVSLTGMVKDSLDVILGKQGLKWSVQDDQLQILPEIDESTAQPIVVLTPETGLVGSPFVEKVIETKRMRSQTAKEISGPKLLSLMNPALTPGRRVEVASKFVSGIFVVKKVTHIGDTHGREWYTEVETA